VRIIKESAEEVRRAIARLTRPVRGRDAQCRERCAQRHAG